jgi:hypothetical protein
LSRNLAIFRPLFDSSNENTHGGAVVIRLTTPCG